MGKSSVKKSGWNAEPEPSQAETLLPPGAVASWRGLASSPQSEGGLGGRRLCGRMGCETRTRHHDGVRDPIPEANLSPFFPRSESGVGAEPDLVHMEAHDPVGGKPGRGRGHRQLSLRVLTLQPGSLRPCQPLVLGDWSCPADLTC